MDSSETQCLMTHYCSQPLKIDEMDILSWLTCLMGLPIKPNCSFSDACRVCLSLSHLQVDNAYTNPSGLTVIIRIIRGADIWDELSRWLLPVKMKLSETRGQPWRQKPITLAKFLVSSRKRWTFPFANNRDAFFLCFFLVCVCVVSPALAHQQALFGLSRGSMCANAPPRCNLYLLKCYQASADGINIICYAGSKGEVCLPLCVCVCVHTVCVQKVGFSDVNVWNVQRMKRQLTNIVSLLVNSC